MTESDFRLQDRPFHGRASEAQRQTLLAANRLQRAMWLGPDGPINNLRVTVKALEAALDGTKVLLQAALSGKIIEPVGPEPSDQMIRTAFAYFSKDAEFPCSASALRETYDMINRLMRKPTEESPTS